MAQKQTQLRIRNIASRYRTGTKQVGTFHATQKSPNRKQITLAAMGKKN
jgi:hypothetical protein